MKMIYCAHKYGGKRRNKKAVEKKISQLYKQYPKYCFISPIHAFGYSYKVLSYENGMYLCIELLSKCDELWILSNDSKGVIIERNYAKEHSIPTRKIEVEI